MVGEKSRIAQVDAVTDAWNRVVALEEQWDEYDAQMCFTPEEREGERLWRELLQARERLHTVKAAAIREIREVGL